MFKRKPVKPEIKSLEEIKQILKQNKQAGGVGFVIAPALMQIASQLGLMGYGEALLKWQQSSVFSQTTDTESSPNGSIVFTWKGPSLIRRGDSIIVGIEQTIKQIDLAL